MRVVGRAPTLAPVAVQPKLLLLQPALVVAETSSFPPPLSPSPPVQLPWISNGA